jgi:hypothetical protein
MPREPLARRAVARRLMAAAGALLSPASPVTQIRWSGRTAARAVRQGPLVVLAASRSSRLPLGAVARAAAAVVVAALSRSRGPLAALELLGATATTAS